ncbi:hypothetical protein FAEPRAM212_01625 [Faecalibacterium prausnitzii M21/2]|uniref:Uncharacterized protein n=1 Tax=Faecalibacterium prausnitzii M21/2 TaxID=411485 RepID=A8SBC3_9FIRM|nr:hypothetical protein FAEPRAM212_01625 [Faecalibacterium prausnitzii M21/2]
MSVQTAIYYSKLLYFCQAFLTKRTIKNVLHFLVKRTIM